MVGSLEKNFGVKNSERSQTSDVEVVDDVFESAVTREYFEDGWDDFEIEGNPGMKDCIKRNIGFAENENSKIYKSFADNLDLSVDVLKEMLQKKVEEMVDRSDFWVAVYPDVLQSIIKDGRWKSQFETNKSTGMFNPKLRTKIEQIAFGFSHRHGDSFNPLPYTEVPEEAVKENVQNRSIYGYFTDGEHGSINKTGTIPPPTAVREYGGINIKIERERALKKATLTFHDSLIGRIDRAPPTPVAKPHFVSLNPTVMQLDSHSRPDAVRTVLSEQMHSSITSWGSKYTEVQYHGGLTLDDVESIHISPDNGMDDEEIAEVREMVEQYNKEHPESPIPLVIF